MGHRPLEEAREELVEHPERPEGGRVAPLHRGDENRQSRIGADSTYGEGLLGPAIVMSAGMGLLITPITTTVTSGTAEQDAGAASGLMNATRQIGGAVGLAALAFALPAPQRRDQAAGVPGR